MRLRYLLPFVMIATPAAAVEIDFATVLKDLDDAPYRFCIAAKPDKPAECAEYVNHTIGFIAYLALNRAPEKPAEVVAAQVLEARRAVLARKVYPGKNEKHIVDLSASEVTLIFDAIAISKQGLPTVETLLALELIDPVRVKGMLEK